MKTKMYQAWGYIGVYELAFYGNFHSEQRALEELEHVLETQLDDESMSEEDKEHHGEAFWFNSKIKEVLTWKHWKKLWILNSQD